MGPEKGAGMWEACVLCLHPHSKLSNEQRFSSSPKLQRPIMYWCHKNTVSCLFLNRIFNYWGWRRETIISRYLFFFYTFWYHLLLALLVQEPVHHCLMLCCSNVKQNNCHTSEIQKKNMLFKRKIILFLGLEKCIITAGRLWVMEKDVTSRKTASPQSIKAGGSSVWTWPGTSYPVRTARQILETLWNM